MGASYVVELIVDCAFYNFTPPRRESWGSRSLGIHSCVPI